MRLQQQLGCFFVPKFVRAMQRGAAQVIRFVDLTATITTRWCGLTERAVRTFTPPCNMGANASLRPAEAALGRHGVSFWFVRNAGGGIG